MPTCKLTTSKNKTYTAEWIGGPNILTGDVLLCLKDERPLAEILPEFDGLERIDAEKVHTPNEVYEGYSALTGISRQPDGSVLITLSKG